MSRRKARLEYQKKYPYPRHQFVRALLRGGIRMASALLLNYEVYGRENLPKEGPLLIVGNHFHFLDSISPIHVTHYPLEFINDAFMPMAPTHVKFIPGLWKTLRIEQGSANLESMRAAEAVLSQKGVLGIMPEGHVHKPPLGKPLPGAAYMALRSGAPIIPIGTYSEDDWDFVGTILHKHRKAHIVSRIGKPFGPLAMPDPEKLPGRDEVRAAGFEIMSQIARLLPPSARGPYLESTQGI